MTAPKRPRKSRSGTSRTNSERQAATGTTVVSATMPQLVVEMALGLSRHWGISRSQVFCRLVTERYLQEIGVDVAPWDVVGQKKVTT